MHFTDALSGEIYTFGQCKLPTLSVCRAAPPDLSRTSGGRPRSISCYVRNDYVHMYNYIKQ